MALPDKNPHHSRASNALLLARAWFRSVGFLVTLLSMDVASLRAEADSGFRVLPRAWSSYLGTGLGRAGAAVRAGFVQVPGLVGLQAACEDFRISRSAELGCAC